MASALGALVLFASAHSAGLFATQLQVLTDDGGEELERALATIAHDVRYAWWVEVTGDSTTIVTGPEGRETTYAFDEGELEVERDRGGDDVLIDSLSAASFTAQTMTRYREDDPVTAHDAFWWSSTPATAGEPLVLTEGQSLGLGFSVRADSPWTDPVEGVEEQVLSAALDQLELPIATLVAGVAVVEIGLHRARAPGDGRPEGPALSTKTVLLVNLPTHPYVAWNVALDVAAVLPRSTPGAWWKVLPGLSFKTTAPSADVPVPLWGDSRTVPPGRSYTLVLKVVGAGAVVLRTHPIPTADGSGIALQDGSSASYVPLAVAIPRRLRGNVTTTATRAVEVVTRVDIVLTDLGGASARASAAVAGQAFVEDPWLGTIPGETPALQGVFP